jgi:4-amino-4-deoxy-L-arabinose transferase-like glycosyltransferase
MVMVFAALLLLVRLGSHGFWEPQEMAVANKLVTETVDVNTDTDVRPRTPAKEPTLTFTEEAAATGVSIIGESEFGSRLPLALLALATLAVVVLFSTLTAGARTGALAGLILLSFPLFLLQARQLLSEIGAVFGATCIVVGGLALMMERRKTAVQVTAPVLLLTGAVIGYLADGMLLGVGVPTATLAIAALLALPSLEAEKRRELLIAAGVASVVAIVTVLWAIGAAFDLVDSKAGDFEFFGKTLQATDGARSALGGLWKDNGNLNYTFSSLFEQLAFGTFPWGLLAPVALGALVVNRRRGRPAVLGLTLFVWVLLTWTVLTILQRKVGNMLFPALPALAMGVAIWVSELFHARDNDEPVADTILPLVALFFALAVAVIAKDIRSFPDKFAAVHMTAGKLAYPEGVKLHMVYTFGGILFAASAFAGIALWRRPAHEYSFPEWMDEKWRGRCQVLLRVIGQGLLAAIAISAILAVFTTQIFVPGLSHRLSSKATFEVLKDLRKNDEPLAVMGGHGGGPSFYAGGAYEKLRNRNKLIDFLRKDERVFAYMPATDHCSMQAASVTKGFAYHVLDDENAKLMLLTNRLEEGERDRNKLKRIMVRERPADTGKPVTVNYENKLKLIGVKLPKKVGRGNSFEITLFYEVLAPVGRNWNIFIHFDGGGQRFQGDHKPHETFCGTGVWPKGGYIIDTVKVEAGGLTYPKGTYDVWAGLFTGSSGNWKNMKVTELSGAEKDDVDRAKIATLEVE